MYAKDNKIIYNTPVPRKKKQVWGLYTKKNNTGGQTQQETSTITKTCIFKIWAKIIDVKLGGAPSPLHIRNGKN